MRTQHKCSCSNFRSLRRVWFRVLGSGRRSPDRKSQTKSCRRKDKREQRKVGPLNYAVFRRFRDGPRCRSGAAAARSRAKWVHMRRPSGRAGPSCCPKAEPHGPAQPMPGLDLSVEPFRSSAAAFAEPADPWRSIEGAAAERAAVPNNRR